MEKFGLGPSSIDFTTLPSPFRSARKRSYSQSKLDSYFSPSGIPSGSFSLSDSFLAAKKSRLSSTSSSSTSKSKAKKSIKRKLSAAGKNTPGKTSSAKKKKDRRSSTTSATNKASKVTPSKAVPGKTTPLQSPKSIKSPPSALKILNKAKKFKQLDLKNAVVTKKVLGPAELQELEAKRELERQRRAAQMEEEKKRRKELRLRKLREQQEQKRLEKLRQKELLKPREDTLCKDSKVSRPLVKKGRGGVKL